MSDLVNITLEAEDNSRVTKIELFIDGTIETTLISKPYIFKWITYEYENNVSYTFFAKAYDSAGNVGLSNLITLIVKNKYYPDSVIATIGVGYSPIGISFTPDGKYVYVSNYQSNNDSVIRTEDNSVINTIDFGSDYEGPYGNTITPDGNYVLVANYSSDDVTIIRTSDNTILKKVPVGSSPHHIAVIPDNKFASVSHRHSNYVSIIRLSDFTKTGTITVGTYLLGLL